MNYEEAIKDYLSENYYSKMLASVEAKKKFNTKKVIKEVAEKFNICTAEAVDNVYDWVNASFNDNEQNYL